MLAQAALKHPTRFTFYDSIFVDKLD